MPEYKEPEWKVDDYGDGVDWYRLKPGGSKYVAGIETDETPSLWMLKHVAVAILREISDSVSDGHDSYEFIANDRCTGGEAVFLVPRPRPWLAEVAMCLIRHVEKLESNGTNEPDWEAGHLLGKLQHAAVQRFEDIGRSQSETAKARLEAHNKARAERREEQRRTLEAEIARLMSTRRINRTSAIARIAKREEVSDRAIRSRLERRQEAGNNGSVTSCMSQETTGPSLPEEN